MIQKVTFEVDVPKNMEPVCINNHIVFIRKGLPKTWKEFVNVANAKDIPFTRFSLGLEPCEPIEGEVRNDHTVNFLPSVKDVEAHLALIKLHNLRDYYRDSFYGEKEQTYSIVFDRYDEKFKIVKGYGMFLSFPSYDIASSFFTNFECYIQQAKELL